MVALVSRLAVIALVPDNYSFDAYQRWAGRDFLLIRDWLPLTQSVVWLVTRLGGGIIAVRVALAVIAAVGMAGGARVAEELGGRAAGWMFIPITVFGPLLAWTTVPYQEGTFLTLLFWGLALGLTARRQGAPPSSWAWLWADLLIGALALVRYEGWPVVLLWLAWRRDRRSMLSLWGAALWLLIRFGLGASGHEPSPVDYADWVGLAERFTVDGYLESLSKAARQAFKTGGLALLIAGVAGAATTLKERRPGSVLVLMILLAQLAATAGWLAGLETATQRMQVVPGALFGLFSAAAAAWAWERGGPKTRILLVVATLLVTARLTFIGLELARDSVASVRPEIRLAHEIEACEGCLYAVIPRSGIGTRDRQDGCEVLQGVSELHHPDDFSCSPWPGPAPWKPTHYAKWTQQGYVTIPMRR